jgi:spore coat protein U-like protein
MNTIRNILVGAASATAIFALATSASAATASADTNAKIIQPITITKDADMNFGTLIRPAADATVTLGTDGVVSGVTKVTGSTSTAAKFTVNGEGGQQYSITEEASLSNGENSLALTLTKIAGETGTLDEDVGTLSGALGAAGSGELLYGASFPITSATATGAYTGTLEVTVNYQ